MGWEDAPIIAAAGQPDWMAAPIVAAAPRRSAEGVFEAIQAGYQGSATGLAMRGKLPDLFLDHSHSTWYEKALSSAGQIVSEFPEMVVGGALGGGVGASVGATAGSVVPGVGTAAGGVVGGLLGTGAGAFAVPAAIREAYIQALTKGEVSSTADFIERTAIVLKSVAKEGAVGALTFGAGGVAGRFVGKAIAPAVGESISVTTATRAISGAATAAELGTMVVAPAALEGRMPEPEDFLNAAIVLGGLKGAAHMAGGLARVWSRTGIEPERVLADAARDPTIKEDLSRPLVVVEGGQMELPGIPRAYQEAARAETAMAIVPGAKALEVAKSPFAEELPQVPGEPAKPAHVNYNYINTHEEAKLALARLSEVYEAEITTQRRGTVSWEQTSQEAGRVLADTLGQRDTTLLMPREPGTAAGAAEILARKQLTVGAAEAMMKARDELLAKGAEVTPADNIAFLQAIERAALIQQAFLGARAEAGRALNILKSTALEADRAKQIQEVISMYGKDPVRLAEMLKQIETPAGALKFAKEATRATTWEKIVEGWKASILSGPVTHAANIMGNLTFLAVRVPVDALAATFGMLHGGERVSAMEPIARVFGSLQGSFDGAKVGLSVLRHGEEVGKAEQFRKAIEGTKGEVIRTTFRLLSAEDAVFKTMNQRAEIYALATRKTMNEGINPLTREFRERIAELAQHPDEAMLRAAEDAGKRFTFNLPLGEKGQAVQTFVRKWHLEWAVPFIRTPGNIAKELARMTPFAPLVKEWREALSQKGPARDRAMAELVMGTGLMTGVMALVFNETVTGQGPADPNKRRVLFASGWQPYSIKINDTYYNYQRLQPVGTLVGLAADLAEVWDRLDTDESDKIPKMLSVAFANAVTNQTFLQGITNIVNAASDPARFGPRFAQQYAGSVVPSLIGQPTQMADPVQREVNSMLDAIKARVPGARETLLPKRDVFGDEVQTKTRLLGVSPVTETTASTDKVRTEAARLGIAISAPPKKVHVGRGTGKLGDVEMTPEQKDAFEEVRGKVAHDILAPIVNSPVWDDLPALAKRAVFKKAFLAANKQGAAAALPPEELGPVIQRITEQFETEAARK